MVGSLGDRLDLMAMAMLTAGARTARRLPVTITSHTGHLAAAEAPFRRALADAVASAPSRPLVSGVAACRLIHREEVIESLAVQLHTRLRFADALRAACECGATAFLEVGPGDGLTQIVNDVIPDVPARPLCLFHTTAGVAKWIERHC